MSTRHVGFGMGPIPWGAVEGYCRSLELDEDQIHAMHHHIKEMDTVYLKHNAKKK